MYTEVERFCGKEAAEWQEGFDDVLIQPLLQLAGCQTGRKIWVELKIPRKKCYKMIQNHKCMISWKLFLIHCLLGNVCILILGYKEIIILLYYTWVIQATRNPSVTSDMSDEF